MSHHFTKDTVEASIWCNKCNRETRWRVVGGRRQYCLTCYQKAKPAETRAPAREDERQGALFGERR